MVQKKIKYLTSIFAFFALTFASIGVLSLGHPKNIEFSLYKEGVYVVSIDSDYFAKNSDLYIPEKLETVENAAQKTMAKVAINAGFFDPNNTKTISYAIKNNQTILNPNDNPSLMGSEELKPHLDKIFNRAEFRLLKCGNKYLFEIAPHNKPLSCTNNCSIEYAVQAGPLLYPTFDLEGEFFILKKEGKVVRQSASSLLYTARSAIGVKGNRIYLIAVSNQNPMSLEELSKLMKEMGFEQAMAFDGGSSTSLFVNIPEKKDFLLNSTSEKSARRVKSVLIVK